jgi:hypothetical protein
MYKRWAVEIDGEIDGRFESRAKAREHAAWRKRHPATSTRKVRVVDGEDGCFRRANGDGTFDIVDAFGFILHANVSE